MHHETISATAMAKIVMPTPTKTNMSALASSWMIVVSPDIVSTFLIVSVSMIVVDGWN